MSKKIVIIGGSHGISSKLTELLLDEGQEVFCFSRTKGELENLNNSNLHHHEFDVLQDDLKDFEIPEQVDGLIYAPGSINLKPIRGLKEEDFKNDFEINVLGAVKSIQALLKPLKKSDLSSVVMFSTVAVQQGMPFHASVAASKGAVEGLGRSLAAELAPKVRVNVIAPSLTETPMAERLLSSDDKRKSSAERHPMKAVGTADDQAHLAAFLLSDKSKWMTGQVIGVDGGLSALKV